MNLDYTFTEGDTGSVLQVTCKDHDGAVIDLSGATVELVWVANDGTLKERTMTAVDLPSGRVKYQFAADELEAPEMSFTTRITDSSGKELSSLGYLVEPVRRRQADDA